MSDSNSPDHDYRLHDAYIAFSAELVRLALLSPALFSFLVVLAGRDAKLGEIAAVAQRAGGGLVFGFACMAAAVLFGLAHRYFATDFMATRIEYLRLTWRDDDGGEGGGREAGGSRRGQALELRREARLRLKLATYSLSISAVALWLGAVSLLWAIYTILFQAAC